VLVRDCAPDEALAVQVFENIGLGVRVPLEARDMANAIQTLAERFATPEEAASYFARPPTWLDQATAAARLSEKVTALLDAGKISSTGAAVQLEKLAKKNEARAESLIDQIEQLPEGEKFSKKVVDNALSAESPRRKKAEEPARQPEESSPASTVAASDLPPWEDAPAPAAAPRSRINPGKVKLVAELLGLDEGDEEELLVRLIDEFLALKRA
jgi:ParB family chromosome partitioning protein